MLSDATKISNEMNHFFTVLYENILKIKKLKKQKKQILKIKKFLNKKIKKLNYNKN